MSVTERNDTEARKEALSKLRLITDRIMLRRMKRDHTGAMELPPKRSVPLPREIYMGVDANLPAALFFIMSSSEK